MRRVDFDLAGVLYGTCAKEKLPYLKLINRNDENGIIFTNSTLNKNKSDFVSFYFSNSKDMGEIKEKLNESELKKFSYIPV